jgi:septum site-determining protein MinC
VLGARIKDSFKIKGSLTPVMIMMIYHENLSNIEYQLRSQINIAPKMFEGAAMILDFCNFESSSINLSGLKKILFKNKIQLLGIKNANEEITEKAKLCQINILANTKIRSEEKKEKPKVKTKYHKKHVRSGQQIYAENSDLVILGNVSAGAEIIADGTIHVYGTLNGRAVAGAKGDIEANIFAAKFNAELVAISGIFKTFENSCYDSTVHIFVLEDTIHCEEIS